MTQDPELEVVIFGKIVNFTYISILEVRVLPDPPLSFL